MGYKIVYKQSGMQRSHIQAPIKRKKKLWPAFAVVVVILSVLIWNKVYKQNTNANATEVAFSTFTENLKEGKGIGESFTVFCKEIIASAQPS